MDDHQAAVPTVDEVAEWRPTEDKCSQDMSDWLKTEEALRAARAQLRQLSARHLAIQENERRRIAADLHDGLGQILSLVKFTIDEAAGSVDADPPAKVKNTLGRLSTQVKSALGELRRIAVNLRPSILDDLGIVAALSWYFRELEAACPYMKFERNISVRETDVPEPLKISIFRIVQEATSNAIKHAKADCIKASLTSAGGLLKLSVEDNGLGFDPMRAAVHRDFKDGIGLQSMKERAELHGGSYEFQSAPSHGTRVSVNWPCLDASDSYCRQRYNDESAAMPS